MPNIIAPKVKELPNTHTLQKPPKPKYSFDTSSLQPGTTLINEAKLLQPEIIFTEKAWLSMEYVVHKTDAEVGWWFLVEEIEPMLFVLDTIIIPRQEVTSIETDMAPEAMVDTVDQLLDQGRDPGRMFAWFHSHVNMCVAPSTQDEVQVEEWFRDLPIFIRGIINKAGDIKIDVYLPQAGVAHTCVPWEVEGRSLSVSQQSSIDAVLKANVKKTPAYIYTPSGYQRPNPQSNNGSGTYYYAQGNAIAHLDDYTDEELTAMTTVEYESLFGDEYLGDGIV